MVPPHFCGAMAESNAFENPVSDDGAEINFDDEDRRRSQSRSRDDGNTTPTQANRLVNNVVPESLETEEGTDEVERWKETLVEHVVKGKENARDRRKRVAAKHLEESKSVIDPEGHARRKWDFLQLVFLSYVAFAVPYRLGFSDSVTLWSAWFWFDLGVDLYFILDIVVSIHTAYYNALGELVVQPAAIRSNYVSSWFIVDLAACFPGNYISYAVDDGGDNSSRMIKLLRMLRLLKLLRLARINRLIRKYEEEFASLMTSFKLGKLVIIISEYM